jgi:electron transport complex protein RnfD
MRENPGAAFASPVTILNKNGFGTQNGEIITSFLNKTLFSLFNIEIPAAYLDFFINPGAGLIADRGLFALLIGSIIMIGAMGSSSVLSAVYAGVFLLVVRFAGALPFGGPPGAGDMIYGLFSGGTLAAALILVVEPASGPKSSFGKLVYVSFAALFTFMFRYGKAEACGALFAAALVNIFAPLFRIAEERWYYERHPVRSLW